MRLLRLAAAALAVAALVTGSAEHASAQQGGVSLTITGMSPRYAQADSTIAVTGTVSNESGSPLAGLTVQLFSSSAPISARSSMDTFIGDRNSAVVFTAPEGLAVSIGKTIPAGGTVTWRAAFTAADAGMSAFGVYPVRAVLSSALSGSQVGEDRTLLPFWPGSHGAISRLKIAWAWPLIDQPRQQACWLADNGLQDSLQPAGRLGTLLQAGSSAAAANAKLTWLIDPALLTDVATMASRTGYKTGGSQYCEVPQPHPSSQAARTWLDTLKATISGQPVVVTPYANVDVAALTHRGLTSDVKTAYQLGDQAAREVIGTGVMTNMSFPAGGRADMSVLTALAASAHVTSVVLASDEMPLADSTGYSEDAVSSVNTIAGSPLRVLLADDTLSSVLRQAGGAQPFAVEQRFLAETAMIAAEKPESNRSVVVSPPQSWAPRADVAETLLGYGAQVPWLRPVTLNSLAAGHDSGGDPRRNPPGSQISKRELSARYLAGVGVAGDHLDDYLSMLSEPDEAYANMLAESLAACESSAWRGGNPGGPALVDQLSGYLSNAFGRVKIVTSPVVQMAGSTGKVPVSIQNNLLKQAIRVRLDATVVTNPGAPNPLSVTPAKFVTVQPGESLPVTLFVHAAPQGPSTLQLRLVSADGTTLVKQQNLTVDSTRYGRAILIVIAAAIGLLLLTSVFRSGLLARRRLHSGEPEEASNEPADA